jgi:Ni/Co efflux regulator RcnB
MKSEKFPTFFFFDPDRFCTAVRDARGPGQPALSLVAGHLLDQPERNIKTERRKRASVGCHGEPDHEPLAALLTREPLPPGGRKSLAEEKIYIGGYSWGRGQEINRKYRGSEFVKNSFRLEFVREEYAQAFECVRKEDA